MDGRQLLPIPFLPSFVLSNLMDINSPGKLVRRALVAMLMLFAVCAFAQFPTKPIRMAVPYPAGGTADLVARSLGTAMSQTLGQPVLIDNKPGADGTIAADFVAKAQPDGYTILFATAGALSYAPAARKSLPYDPVADFTAIGQMGEFGYFVFVHPSLPVHNIKEFLVYLKANPGKLNHGQTASSNLIMSSTFAQTQKVEFQQVPYKGEAPLTPDFLSGRIDFTFGSGGLIPLVKDGKIRAIGTLLQTRSPLLPDVPTLAESGVVPPGIKAWTGIVGPAKMAPDVVQRLSRALVAALSQSEVRERFASMAGEVRPSTPDQLSVFIKEQQAIYLRDTRAAGIQAE